ncbi:hypothetical protein [Parasediminibacterium sp. JCM 36343]|uniref:hypothetical protein n=1 Tax=Parasediminibacterium sp. JCM 36343 TaxID=3374279 RepID=UPI00397A5B74
MFDYAVSIYSIPEKTSDLILFINSDPTRPFFLRPSFLYFFTSEWYRDITEFWKAYWNLCAIESKVINLLVRLVLNGIIVSEYSSIEDIVAITNHSSSSIRATTLKNLLQSIRLLRKLDANKVAGLILYLSKHLQTDFIFEVSFLLDQEIVNGKSNNSIELYGEAARNLLRYILLNRQVENTEFLDRIGFGIAVSMVAKTYSTNTLESKNLLLRILEMTQESNFEIGYLSQLSDAVKYILPFDSHFVAEIYLAIFGHTELSNQETQMGASVLMSFKSNRRQDYELCYFRLQEFFPEFLQQASSIAIRTGLTIVNKYVIDFKIQITLEEIKFNFNGRECVFIPDLSVIWVHDFNYHENYNIANKIIDFLEKLIIASNPALDALFIEYIQYAKVGYTWRLLFELGTKYPSKLAKALFPLISPLFLRDLNISFYVTNFIDKSAGYFTKKQISQIERSVFFAFKKEEIKQIATVLTRLPIARLSFKKSKKIVYDSGPVDNSLPLAYQSSVTTFTSEMWMQERGVDVKSPENEILIDARQKLEAFNNKWRNDEPSINDYSLHLEIALDAYSKLESRHTTLHSDLFYSVLNEIAASLSIICRNLTGCPEEQIKLIKKVISYSFNYLTEFDANNEGNSPAHGWSPTPRIVATEGLLYIYIYDQDEIFYELLRQALNDSVPIIRYMAVNRISLLAEKDYARYWKLYIDRIEKEDDGFIYAALLGNIHVDLNNVEKQVNDIIDLCLAKSDLFEFSDNFIDAFAKMLIWFFLSHKSERAHQELINAISISRLCKSIIFELCNSLHPSNILNEFASDPEKYKPLFQIIKSYVETCGKRLSSAKDEEFNSGNKEIKNSFEIIHEVIIRLYFQLDEARIGTGKNQFSLPINDENRRGFYFLVKPIYQQIVLYSSKITGKGLIIGNSAHYFIESLNHVLHYDVKDVLSMAASITQYSISTGYTYDAHGIAEMVKLTEKLLADHRDLLLDDSSFKNLIDILDIYINSGSVQALTLLWRLNEVFR